MFGFPLWRLPARVRLVRPFASGPQRRTLGPALGRRSVVAALGQAPKLPLSVVRSQDMAPWVHPGASSGSSGGSKRSEGSTGKGGGKQSGKGRKDSGGSLKQLGHLTPQAKALQASAAAMGFALSLKPKGQGKGKQSRRTYPTKVFSAGPAGIVKTAVVKEGGRPAVMEVNGKQLPIAWLCHDCHYPHHNPRKLECKNCGEERQFDKEPTNFIRSKVRLEPPTESKGPSTKAPPSTLASASAKADQSKPKAPPPASAKTETAAPKGPPPLPKHGTAPPPPAKSSGTGAAEEEIAITFLQGPAASQGQATAQQLNAAVEASGDTPKDGFIEEDAEVEAVPLYIPACLNTAAVKLLIKCGVEVASKFKGHFNLKTVGPSELQQQLALARKKLQGISTLDQTLWAAEIAMAKADVAALEEKTGMAADADGLSMDQAPGVDTGVLSKLMQLLSRHQKAMAREAEEHQVLVTSLEAQVAELQLQISSAQCLHVQQTATKEELLVGLQTKVDALTMAPPPSKVSYAQASDAQSCLKQQLGKRLSAEWLASNGMTGITEQAVSALLAEFTSALREAGPGVSSTILAPAPKAATTMGERKRALGQDECWADTAADADDDMDPC